MLGTNHTQIVKQLKIHEGCETHPYTDTVGKITIGVGRNLTDRGLSDDEIALLLMNDLRIVESELDAVLPWWHRLTHNRQAVLIDMMFNLGRPRFLQFKKFLAALSENDYETAAAEMLDSRWARQVGNRAKTLARMMARDEDFEAALAETQHA